MALTSETAPGFPTHYLHTYLRMGYATYANLEHMYGLQGYIVVYFK